MHCQRRDTCARSCPWSVLLAAAVAMCATGCAWQPYVITRAIRHATGARARFHVVVPVAAGLRQYRVIELHDVANLLPERVPAPSARYLNDRIAKGLGTLPSKPSVVRPAPAIPGMPDADPAPSEPTLVVDGFLDDFDAGSLPLRIAELGFNHIAVTVRVRLYDKRSHAMLGAVSVTAEDDRETATTTAAINHVADRIRAFVAAGYAW